MTDPKTTGDNWNIGDPCQKCGAPHDEVLFGHCIGPAAATAWGHAWGLGREHAMCGKPRINPSFWTHEGERAAYVAGYDGRREAVVMTDAKQTQTTDRCPFKCDIPWPHAPGGCVHYLDAGSFDVMRAALENPPEPTLAVRQAWKLHAKMALKMKGVTDDQ